MTRPAWLARHVRLLRASYHPWSGRHLLAPELGDAEAVEALWAAGFAVLSHGTGPDPLFNYGNALALQLFEMDWGVFTALPSRLSAEPMQRDERARLLTHVAEHGSFDDYSGVRISASGRRFRIEQATVWNLLDEHGAPHGQAARIPRWRYLQPQDKSAAAG